MVQAGSPYFYIELPDGSKLFAHGRSIGSMDLNFGREILASQRILNCPNKADWRNVKLTKEKEIEIANKIKSDFKSFDFNADSDSD